MAVDLNSYRSAVNSNRFALLLRLSDDLLVLLCTASVPFGCADVHRATSPQKFNCGHSGLQILVLIVLPA